MKSLPKKYAQEDVMVLDRSAVDEFCITCGVGHLPLNSPDILSRAWPMKRERAENETNYVQLVAYYLVEGCEGYLTHRRTSRQPEQRLVNVRSLGFSGHLGPKDMEELLHRDLFGADQPMGFTNRELGEEVEVKVGPQATSSLRRYIWDPSEPLGAQHLALVCHITDAKEFRILEPGLITDAKFESVEKILAKLPLYSSWTRLLLMSPL
jgi:predicted NUDIX family phosphoesterase